MSDPTDKDLPPEHTGDLPGGEELEDYLRGGSAVSRQYRQLHSADVPAELDRLVLRQAQEAVKPRPAKSRSWMRWSGPLALAASAVLVISIVIESGVQREQFLLAPEPASAPADVAVQQERTELPAAASAVEERTRTAGVAEDKASNASDQPPTQAAPAAPLIESPGFVAPAPAEAPEQPREQASARQAIRPVAPPPVAAPAPDMPAPVTQFQMPPEESDRRAEAAQQKKLAEPAITRARARELARDRESFDAVIVTAQRRQSTEASAAQDAMRGQQNRVAGPRNSVAAPGHSFRTDEAEEEDEPRSYSDPEEWLRDIRDLRKDKKHAEADREWRRFREAFPNYEVAEDDVARGTLR